MKKNFYFVILLLISNFSLAQNFNWITPNQTYLKMYIADDGIYRINKVDFTGSGVNPDVIDPRTVKVYYKGNQIPIYFNGEQDGVFNDTDYFDFYGKRNYGGPSNVYNSDSAVVYVTDEYFDLYSDTSVYWIGWGGAYGTRFQTFNYTSFSQYPWDYYYKKLHFERDMIYSKGETLDPQQDCRYFDNKRFQGESWYWQLLYWGNFILQNFSTPYLTTTVQPCKLKVFAYPYTIYSAITNEQRLALHINNILIDTLVKNHFARFDTTLYFPSSYLNPSSNNVGRVKYTPPDAAADYATLNLDMFEVSYPRRFDFDSNRVSFSSELTDTSSRIYKLRGFNSANPLFLYDVKYGYRITSYSLSADTLVFTGKGDGVFEVLNKNITKKPFRIKQRTVPNYASASNGADYLVVYNKLLESQAEQLRAYRNSHDGFRSVKAEMEDIYDIFNYGIENPVAVRNFTKYVYENWTQPRVSYICLFGRGSLDPKKCAPSTVYPQNLVPVYGNPPTDGYFANFNLNAFTYFHQVDIGRIPAYTAQEAQDMVNKIIAYESQPLDKWTKKSIFISGGHRFIDQQQLINQSNIFINSYIQSVPLSLNSTKIYLNDTSGTVTYNYSDSIKNSINRGALFVSFLGHTSVAYWDNVFTDPNVLSNGAMQPVIFSMTCFTGKNAESDSRGYGEKFMLLPGKGAIGFISTTGWSFFPGGGNVFEQYFLNAFANDSLRRMGDIVKKASVVLSASPYNFGFRNTINSYNLIGDPALKLLLPKYPEFDIQLNDYGISNSYPVVRENVSLKIFPKNLGTYADSCKIRFQVLKNNQNHSIKDTVVYSWGFVDTVVYNFKLDTVGIYSMKVILDQDNWYTLEQTANNTITFPLKVKNSSFVPIKPVDNMIIKRDTVEFVGINPNINTTTNAVKLIVQFDTSKTFSSPVSQTHFTNSMTGAATKFKIRIPILDTNVLYYWHLNAVVNNADSLGWSEIRRFKYNINLPLEFAKNTSKINLEDANYATLPGDSNITIYKNKFGQYNNNELSFIRGDNSGLRTEIFTGNLIASDWGGDPWEVTSFTVNNYTRTLTVPNVDWSGLFFVKVSKNFGTILDTKHIYMAGASSSDSVISYLNTFDSTNILMALKLVSTGVTGSDLSVAARNKFKQFGSTLIDTLNIYSWDRWSFISYPNSPAPIVSEGFGNTDWVPTVSSMQPVFKYNNASITHTFGPAKTWKDFSWQQLLYNGTSIKFDVYGIDRFGTENLLMSNVTTNNLVDLQSINAYTYPKLKLITKLNIDPIFGSSSPVLQSMKLNYVAPSELALDYNTFIKSDSLLNGGDSLGISLAYYNVGYVNLNGYTRDIYTYSNTGQKILLKSETNPATLKIDSADYIKSYVRLVGLPNIRKYNNYITLYFEVTPLPNQNDLYEYNNIAPANIVVKGTSLITGVELYSDGMKVMGGEFVRTKPDVEIKLKDKSLNNLNSFDTSDFKVFINNIYQPYSTRSTNGLRLEGFNPGGGDISIKFNPTLPEGENIFKLVSRKSNGDDFDTTRYSVIVSNQLLIKDLYNYPNPMKSQTGFIFNLGGNSPPTACRIKIYTVSGRLVKIINASVNIGFNQVNWDGRDNEGDYMANGVYFYRMTIEGDTKIESPIQKIAILK